MSDVRNEIFKKLLKLGRNIKHTHISELASNNHLEKCVIKSDLLDFDYSKQRINDDALDYLLNCGPGIPPFAAEVTNE